MKTILLGDLLQLKSDHHYFSIPVYLLGGKQPDFIILFQQEGEVYLVNDVAEDGQTLSFKTASHFHQDQLLLALGALPLDQISQTIILELPAPPARLSKAEIQLKGIFSAYRQVDSVLDFLKMSPRIAKELEGLIEEEKRQQLAATYDPFRHPVRQEERAGKEDRLDVVSDTEYRHLTDFHPFIQSQRGNVYKVPVDYFDPDKEISVTIDIMGWYFYGKQLKIRWRPRHTRKGRWRSSLVSVDKKTGQYFFQGELYKKGNFPVFLNHMSFNKGIPLNLQGQFKENFDLFLSIIDSQKQKALLRIYAISK